jgi:hypothetical protein
MNRTLMLGSISLALALSGCGYLPGGGSHSSAASPTVDPADQAVKFAQCMRSHGIQMADPVNGKITIKARSKDAAKMDAAMKACRKYSPGATGAGPVSGADLDRQLAIARCLRAHGLDVPDPKAGSGIQLVQPPGKTEADVNKAMQACSAGPQKSRGSSGSSDSGRSTQNG